MVLEEMTRAQRGRGWEAEDKVFKALEHFQQQGHKFSGETIIKEVKRSEPWSRVDRQGIDLIIEFQDGKVLSIQVKDWWNKEIEKQYMEKRICFIGIWPNEDEVRARTRVLNAIDRFLKKNSS